MVSMELVDIIEPGLIVNSKENVSRVATKMYKKKKYEALVVDNGNFMGVITAIDIVKRPLSNPERVRISYFIRNIKPLTIDSSVEDVTNQMLVSDFRSFPIKHDNRFSVVTKEGLFKLIDTGIFSGKDVKDVMQFPYCASTKDNLATVRSLMRDLGLTRIPVVGEDGKIYGLVDSLSLLSTLESKARSRLGEKIGEKTGETVSVTYFTRRDIPVVRAEDELVEAIEKMLGSETCTVLVEKDGKFAGMVTPKDLFKVFGQVLEDVYLKVSGMQEEDEFIKSLVNKMLNNTVSRLVKMVSVNYISLHVDRYKKTGKRVKYSVHGRLVTNRGSFYANDSYWDLTKTVKEVLMNLEKEIQKKLGKKRLYERRAH